MTSSYRSAQLTQVCPDEDHKPEEAKVKFISEHGETKWLNISYAVFEEMAITLITDEVAPWLKPRKT